MGKTAKGVVWLDPNKTTPYEFYQYWRNIDDADVMKCLKMLTFVPVEELAEIEKWDNANKKKELLAYELTALVHGDEEAKKAVRFYIGYLTSEDVSEYLSQALVAALKGTMDENSNHQRALLFKLCVEVDMLCHTIAAHYRADEIDRRGLRAFAVREVKETNGQISFDHALDVQRQLPPEADDDWPG